MTEDVRLDLDRERRIGLAEAVYCAGKDGSGTGPRVAVRDRGS